VNLPSIFARYITILPSPMSSYIVDLIHCLSNV
jgi:hypothetical protein